MSDFEPEELSKKERLKRRNAEYYARNREKINQRSKEYWQKHKEEVRATRRKYGKVYRETHSAYVRDNIRKWREEHAEQVAARHAARYRECREMTERAKFECPVFKFLTFVRAKSVATYTLAYKREERVVPKMARVCDALRVMNGCICPLVMHEITEEQEMISKCPMNKAFRIPNAAAEIARIAAIMRNKQAKK